VNSLSLRQSKEQGGAGILHASSALASAQIASILECGEDVAKIYVIGRFCGWNQPPVEGEDSQEATASLDYFKANFVDAAVQAGVDLLRRFQTEAEWLYNHLQQGFTVHEGFYEQRNLQLAKTTAKQAAAAATKIPSNILGEEPDWPSLDRLKEERLKVQHLLRKSIKVALRRDFIFNYVLLEPHHVGRLHSASDEGEALFSTIPAWSSLRFPADGNCYRLATSMRFGLALPGLAAAPCQCHSGNLTIDPYGYHLFSACNLKGTGKTYRHDVFKREVAELLSSVGYHVTFESGDTIKLSQANSRQRTDILILNYEPGKTADIDVSIADSRKLFFGSNGSHKPSLKNLTPDAAALIAEKNKNDEYLDFIQASGNFFFPIVMEYLGRWGPSMKDFFKKNLAFRLKSKSKAAEDRDKYGVAACSAA